MTNSYPLEVNKSGARDKDLALETTANHETTETAVLAAGPGAVLLLQHLGSTQCLLCELWAPTLTLS